MSSITVLDFGSQYAQIIVRRVREVMSTANYFHGKCRAIVALGIYQTVKMKKSHPPVESLCIKKEGASSMNVLETDRLILRKLSIDDAGFILDLLNQPSFLHFIGDRCVRTLEDACDYILKGPIASYERLGFGLYLTALKESGVPIGICGLVKRESLEDVDVGFALLPQFWSKGYASESASAVMAYGKSALGLNRIVGVTSADNYSSIRVLEKLGLRFVKTVRLSADGPELKLFADEKE